MLTFGDTFGVQGLRLKVRFVQALLGSKNVRNLHFFRAKEY